MQTIRSYHIENSEKNILLDVYTKVLDKNPQTQGDIVRECGDAIFTTYKCMKDLFERIQSEVRHPRGSGCIVISGLPHVDDSRILTAVVGFLLGQVTKYEGEGDYIIEIKVQPNAKFDRSSFRNAKEFLPHTDLSYSSNPPPYFYLHSLHNDPSEGGFSTICFVDEIVAQLSENVVEELRKPQFIFPAPSHYRGTPWVVYPILEQNEYGQPLIRFRRDGIRAKSREGIGAIVELVQIMNKCVAEMNLADNSVLFIDNKRCLHGRTSFLYSSLNPTPRHLNRTYVS